MVKIFEKSIGIIGAGRLGKALASALKSKNCYIAGISCLTYAESKVVADELAVPIFTDNNQLAQKADVVFITVPDNQIVDVACGLLSSNFNSGKIFLHCSGAMSAAVLPEGEKIFRGSFHPLQSFAFDSGVFAGIYIAMDGDQEAMLVARNLCDILEATPLIIPSKDRALYHAVACMASNHLVTLLALAQAIFARWTDTPDEAREALWPLVQGSLNNFVKLGAKKALTGPVVRGDSKTIASHLAVLPSEVKDFYRVMSLYTLELALQNNALSKEQITEMQIVLNQRSV